MIGSVVTLTFKFFNTISSSYDNIIVEWASVLFKISSLFIASSTMELVVAVMERAVNKS